MRSRSWTSRSNGERNVTRSGIGPSSASGCATSRPRCEPHAERAEALLVVEPPRLRERQRLGLGIPALGEIPDALLALPADDRHLAARGEELEHQAHLALAPPAVVLASVAGRVGDLAREERPALAQLLQDVAAVGGTRLDPLDGSGARSHDRRDHHADLPDVDVRAGRGRRAQGLRLLARREPDAARARRPRSPRSSPPTTASRSPPASARRRRSCTSSTPATASS